MLTKLRYARVCTEDLIFIYLQYIRTTIEYCSVVFDSSLTARQSTSLDRCKAVSLRIILQDNFVSYSAALKMTALSRLSDPRQTRCWYFSIKCKKDKQNSKFFSTNPNLENVLETQGREQCKVNFCQTQQCHATLSQTAQQPLAPPGGQGGQGWIRAGSVRTRGEEVGRRGEKVGIRGQDGQTRKKTIGLHK